MTDWVAAASRYFPFLAWIGGVNGNTLKADLMAGLTGAVIVLPQSVAFAVIAGLPPEYGLYTAMITPIVAALFGSSLHLISGPTTAISLVIFATISNHAQVGSPEFISLALTITFLAGAFQFALGIARLGIVVNFVSHSVPASFPPRSRPDFSFATFRLLAPGAFAVALLGLIEAVSISRMIASKSH